MPAPDFESLYDFENNIEDAVKCVLARNGVAAFAQRETVNLPTPRVDIQLKVHGVQGHRANINPPALPVQFTFDAWNFDLALSITTARLNKNDTTSHGRYRGKVRFACQYFANLFTSAVMPWYVFTQIQESGTDPQINVSDDTDISAIHFAGIFTIRTEAWPLAGAPAG